MLQGAGGAQVHVKRVANPACASRGTSCISAVLRAFRCVGPEKIRTSRTMSMLICSCCDAEMLPRTLDSRLVSIKMLRDDAVAPGEAVNNNVHTPLVLFS